MACIQKVRGSDFGWGQAIVWFFVLLSLSKFIQGVIAFVKFTFSQKLMFVSL